jgi:hypothetical protein
LSNYLVYALINLEKCISRVLSMLKMRFHLGWSCIDMCCFEKNARAVVWMLEIELCDLFYLNAFLITISLSFLHRMFYMFKCNKIFTVAY